MEKQGKNILIIVDLQNDFCEGGSLGVNKSLEIIPIINNIRKLDFDYIAVTRDYHPENHVSFASSHEGEKEFTTINLKNGKKQELWPVHCLQGTKGCELHQDLVLDQEKDLYFFKGTKQDLDCYSAFGTEGEDTGLTAKLKELNVNKTFIVGLAYDFCVGSTAIDSAKNGLQTYIITDATKSVAEPFEKNMNERLQEHGEKIIKITSDQINQYL